MTLKKVKATGILINKPQPEKSKTIRTPENIAAVKEYRRSQQLNISETSLRRILHKDFAMTPYKVQLVQELKPIDHPTRFRFAKWACDRFTEDADFGKKKKSSFQMKLIMVLMGM